MPQAMSTRINPATGQPWKTGDTFGSSTVTIGPNGEFQLTGTPKPLPDPAPPWQGPVQQTPPPWQGPQSPPPDMLKLLPQGTGPALPQNGPPIGVPPMPQGGPPMPVAQMPPVQPPGAQLPPPFMPLPPAQQVTPPFNGTAPTGVAPPPPPGPPPQIAGQQPDPAWWSQWSNFWQNQQAPGQPLAQNQPPQSLIPATNGPQVRQASNSPFNTIPRPELRNNGPLSRRV